ncbi:MAG: hypothetical protein HY999_05510 [Nitrospinae bacterium]|nr:hypothetical protein [Nitrospinota bacterium]
MGERLRAERLSDIVEIPEVKLVVELDDADNDPEGIISSFVFTREVEESIHTILGKIDKDKGCGTFIKGNFGSGKSHLLSYLYLLLKDKDIPLLEGYSNIKAKDIKIIKVSLVKYPASQGLEEIVLTSFGYKGDVVNREETFREIVDRPTVIIIDELSEFLRSKPSASSFYEDIRFLQFIGEFSFHNTLWIIASLQEWIEETGHISSNIFNRIKDRYQIRINLTSKHIEDIIDQRIVIKREGAEEIIKDVFSELRRYYPHLPLKYEEFRKTYPLHPFTIRYLSGLSPVFSQHRGVIHFVFSEVKKILNGPPDVLITPEVIFDHFEDRIREIPEYSSLARVVYDYYNDHIEEILPHSSQREIGLSTIKILILSEISPFEKRKTAKDIAEILLKKISTLTTQINYEFINKGILEPLVSHQMYINRDGEVYYIDSRVDEGLKIKGKIKGIRERFEDRNHLFLQICNILSLSYLPLKDVREGKRYRFIWQNSLRECVVIVSLNSPIKRDEVERMLEGVRKRLDGFFIILSPFSDGGDLISSLKERFPSPFLSSLIFWIPRDFTDEELIFVEEFIARSHLLEEFPNLRNEVQRDDVRFREIMTNIYFGGKIIYASGKSEGNLSEIGYLPIEKLLSHLFDPTLSELHPNHYQIMPRVDYFSSHHLNNLFTHFIRRGKITLEDAEKKGLTPYIKGLLEPMGIIRKRGGGFLITLEAENELVSHILNLTSQEDDLMNLKITLKKGKWGMGNEQMNLLISALIVSGYLVSYRRDELIELKELSQLISGEITRLKVGKTLSPELLGYIHCGSFIWGEVEDIPTPLTQKEMWKELLSIGRKERGLLEEVNHFIDRYKDYSVFKKISIDSSILNRLSLFFNSLSPSLSPTEGLERGLSYLKENPDLKGELNYLERIHRFFSEELQLINKYYLYLTHPSLNPPKELEEKQDILIADIENYLNTFAEEFTPLREGWEDFFERFIDNYKEGHELYYQAPLFKMRREVQDSEEGKTLKRISNIVRSITFDWDWWEVKRELEKLPDTCREDLNYELFMQPICRCGLKIGDEPPTVQTDFIKMCTQGIFNFLRFIQMPQSREKLDSYILGLRDTGREGVVDKISSIMNIDLININLSLLLPLLTDEVLEEIEKALKGRWKVKEVKVEDFLGLIKGRRLRYNEIKELFLKWIGDEEETIIWVKDREDPEVLLLRDELAKYGVQGERVSRKIGIGEGVKGDKGDKEFGEIKGIEGRLIEGRLELEEEGILNALEGIKWPSFSTDELFDFLKRERIGYLRKRLREEIFHRLWGKRISEERIDSTDDETMKEILSTIKLISEEERYKGIEVFTNVIAPLFTLVEKLRYDNLYDERVLNEVIEKIQGRFNEILMGYEKREERFDGVRDIRYVKERLKGVVVILDGLRYDLWFILRKILINEGWKIKEEYLRVSVPSLTSSFRIGIGIEDKGEDKGYIDGKGYALLKWAERGMGKRGLKRFLNGEGDLKFLHFNFIDSKLHNSTLDLYPLYMAIKGEFLSVVLPIIREIPFFYLISDHGFTDTKRLKERYTHGGGSTWETILPFAEVTI